MKTPDTHRDIEQLLDDSPTLLLIAMYIGAQLVMCAVDEPSRPIATNTTDAVNEAIADFAEKFKAIDRALLPPLAYAVLLRLHARGIDVSTDIVYTTPPS